MLRNKKGIRKRSKKYISLVSHAILISFRPLMHTIYFYKADSLKQFRYRLAALNQQCKARKNSYIPHFSSFHLQVSWFISYFSKQG